MAVQTTNLYLLKDLEDPSKAKTLADPDLRALQSVADWIKTFVVRPHEDLGRPGPVCPFVPEALEHDVLWLAAEQVRDRGAPHVAGLMDGYKSLFLDAGPFDGDDSNYRVIVVVFTDLPADRAQVVFDDALQQLAAPSYVDDGIVFGPFYQGNTGTALYNANFRPFQSPVPFLFVRQGVISDWKFYLDNQEWLDYWANRFGGSAVSALAEELRRLPWRARRD